MVSSYFRSSSRSASLLLVAVIAATGCRDAQRGAPGDTPATANGEQVDETVAAACDYQLNEGDWTGGLDENRRCLDALRWPALPRQDTGEDDRAWTRGEGPIPGQPTVYGIIQATESHFGDWSARHFGRGVPVARVIVTADVNQGGLVFRGARDGSWENVIWIRRRGNSGVGDVFVQSYRRSGAQMIDVSRLQRMQVELAYHGHPEQVPASARWRYAPPPGTFMMEAGQQTGSLEHGGVFRLASSVVQDPRFASGDGFWVRCGGGCCTGTSRAQ